MRRSSELSDAAVMHIRCAHTWLSVFSDVLAMIASQSWALPVMWPSVAFTCNDRLIKDCYTAERTVTHLKCNNSNVMVHHITTCCAPLRDGKAWAEQRSPTLFIAQMATLSQWANAQGKLQAGRHEKSRATCHHTLQCSIGTSPTLSSPMTVHLHSDRKILDITAAAADM
jgi:hypothetical protein